MLALPQFSHEDFANVGFLNQMLTSNDDRQIGIRISAICLATNNACGNESFGL